MTIPQSHLARIKEWEIKDEKDDKVLQSLISHYEKAEDMIRKQAATIDMLTYLMPALKKQLQQQELLLTTKRYSRKPSADKVRKEKGNKQEADVATTISMFEPLKADTVEELYKKGQI